MTGVTTYQGHFTTPASGTTTQTVGFAPYAIIFWVNGANGTSDITWSTTTGIESSTGFAAYDGTNTYNANSGYMVKYATTGGVTVGLNEDATNCFAVYSTGGSSTPLVAGYVSSFTAPSNGFTVTYTNFGANYVVNYLAIGGDCNKACITAMTMDAAQATPNTYQQFTMPNSGVNNWTPSAVLFLSDTATATGWVTGTTTGYFAIEALGAMDAAGNQNSNYAVTQGQTTSTATVTGRGMSNAYCLAGCSTFKSTIDAYLSYNAMSAGHFTVNKGGTNYASVFGLAIVYALCLYSTTANEILCGAWTSANSTTETVTTGITTVQGALFRTDSATTYVGTTDSRLTIGASDGTHNGCMAFTDVNARTKNTGAGAYSITASAKSLLIANTNNTTTSTATTTFSGAGMAMAWSSGVTDDICYVAFGSGSTSASWTESTIPNTTSASSTPTISSSSSLALPNYTACLISPTTSSSIPAIVIGQTETTIPSSTTASSTPTIEIDAARTQTTVPSCTTASSVPTIEIDATLPNYIACLISPTTTSSVPTIAIGQTQATIPSTTTSSGSAVIFMFDGICKSLTSIWLSRFARSEMST